MTAYEKLHGKGLYDPNDPELAEEQLIYMDMLHKFNQLSPSQTEERDRLLKQMFAEIGEGCYITSPFYANWGGRHVHLGNGVYINFGAMMVDDTHIYIGDYTMLGPGVIIATGTHPVLPQLRGKAPRQFNLPVTIGKNCWIGAGSIILPGVTVGDNSVIGAGSVVTKDIPENVVALGDPCGVLRPISERDREYYYRDMKIDPHELD